MAAELQAIEILDRINEVKEVVQANNIATEKLSGRVDVLTVKVDSLVDAQKKCDDHATRIKSVESQTAVMQSALPLKAATGDVVTRKECDKRHDKQDDTKVKSITTWFSFLSIVAAWIGLILKLLGVF